MLALGSSTRNAYKMSTTNEFGYSIGSHYFQEGESDTHPFLIMVARK
jgi:hypothetical protein